MAHVTHRRYINPSYINIRIKEYPGMDEIYYLKTFVGIVDACVWWLEMFFWQL